jgi:hypothetical protein
MGAYNVLGVTQNALTAPKATTGIEPVLSPSRSVEPILRPLTQGSPWLDMSRI